MHSHVALHRVAVLAVTVGCFGKHTCACNTKGMSLAYGHSTYPCRANCSQTGSLQTPAAHVAVENVSRLEKAIDVAMKLTAGLITEAN